MGRALTVRNVLTAKFNGLPFDGRWHQAIGTPERAHSWAIWGQSGSGKTTFCMQLARYLSSFEPVIYNSLEEGLSKSMQMAYQRAGLTTTDSVQLISENMKELNVRLLKPRSAGIIIIDSIKYTRMRWDDYQQFSERFPDKLKIWVGHAHGKEPKGSLAQDIRYDSSVKIYTEGHRAFITSRFSETGEGMLDIWPDGAAKYFGDM